MIRSFDIARVEAVPKGLGDQIEGLWADMAALQLGFSQKQPVIRSGSRSFFDMA